MSVLAATSPKRPGGSRRRKITQVVAGVGLALLGWHGLRFLDRWIHDELAIDVRREPLPVRVSNGAAPVPPVFESVSVDDYEILRDLQEDADGNVWGVSQYQIVRFDDGDPSDAVRVLGWGKRSGATRAHRRFRPDSKQFSFARVAVGADAIWATTFQGDIVERRGRSWRRFAGPKNLYAGQIVVHDGQLLALAPNGLVRLVDDGVEPLWEPAR